MHVGNTPATIVESRKLFACCPRHRPSPEWGFPLICRVELCRLYDLDQGPKAANDRCRLRASLHVAGDLATTAAYTANAVRHARFSAGLESKRGGGLYPAAFGALPLLQEHRFTILPSPSSNRKDTGLDLH